MRSLYDTIINSQNLSDLLLMIFRSWIHHMLSQIVRHSIFHLQFSTSFHLSVFDVPQLMIVQQTVAIEQKEAWDATTTVRPSTTAGNTTRPYESTTGEPTTTTSQPTTGSNNNTNNATDGKCVMLI